ncbi:MFS transporter [Alloyangia pacifica]|uniref:MFS transporter n=1 Tax=Alloyangia pacifica TaxID=311180 RepID=UPI001CFCDF97|nr:MFS transporter [Alloyangia pacifica]
MTDAPTDLPSDASDDPHAVPTRSEAHRIAIAFTVALAFLMQGVDTTLLTIAIPRIAEDLQRSPLSLHLLVTAYLLALAVFMPVSGWFADRFGARRVFCGAVGLFTLGSVLAAFMPGLEAMVPCRVLQGFGGALMTPVGRMIVLRAFGPERTLDGMTWLTVPVLIGPLIGPLVGAALIEFYHWRLLFFVTLPICLAAVLGMLWLVPPLPALPRDEVERFDLSGFALAGLALVLFQLGLEAISLWGAAGLALLPLSALIFGLYRRHAQRVAHPALVLALFSAQRFRVGVIAGGIGRVGMNSTVFLLPLFLQLAMGFRPLHAGLFSAIGALGSLVSKPLLKRLITRHGYRPVLIALTLTGSATLAAFAPITPGWPVWVIIALVIVSGAIRTLYFNAVNTLTYAGVPARQLSRATATAGVFQQLTMGLGISVAALLLHLLQGDAPALEPEHFQAAYLLMALIPLFALPWLARLSPEAPPLRKTTAPAENKSIGAARGVAETDPKIAGLRSDTAA